MKRYLVTTDPIYPPFFTDNFNSENHFNSDIDMVVYDLMLGKYTTDGLTWIEIKHDHL